MPRNRRSGSDPLQLDHVVFRLGFAPTLLGARQLVRHGHVLVNGEQVMTPSSRIGFRDTITFRDPGRMPQEILDAIQAGPRLPLPKYLKRSPDGLSGLCIGVPAGPGDAADEEAAFEMALRRAG